MCYSDDPATTCGAVHAPDWRVAVEHALHAARLRTSSARTAVLDWIAVAERPFTAEMIVQQLVNGWGTGSRPTVYYGGLAAWGRVAGPSAHHGQ